jgi:hypothetical protein
MIVRIFNRGTVALLTEKGSITIIAAESTVNAYGALYREASQTPSKKGAGFAITTPVAIYQFERDNFKDRIHIGLLDSITHIVQWPIVSASFVWNITKHQDTRFTY